MKKILASVLFTMAAASAHAQTAYIDESSVTYLGTGCPEGSVDYTITDDGKLDFDFLENTADTDAFNLVAHKNCLIKLRVYAPANYRIAPSQVTLTGEAIVAALGKANASAKLSLVGVPEMSAGKVFNGGFEGSFEVSSASSTLHFSSCGGYLDLKIRSQIRAERSVNDVLQTSVLLQDGATNRPFAIRCPIIFDPCH